MRLKKGKPHYKLPPDFIGLESVMIKEGGNLNCVRIVRDCRELVGAKTGLPVPQYCFVNQKRFLEFFPPPEKAYYAEIHYHTIKKF